MRLDHELSHPPTGRESQKVDLIVTENPEEPDDILDDELRLIRGRPQVPAASPAPAQVEDHNVTSLRNREQPGHQIAVVPARAAMDHHQGRLRRLQPRNRSEVTNKEVDVAQTHPSRMLHPTMLP